METIRTHWYLIQFIYKTQSVETIECVLKNLSVKEKRFLSELALNVYKGNVKISSYYRRKLRVHKSLIINWSKSNHSFASNPLVLIQLVRSSYKVLQAVV